MSNLPEELVREILSRVPLTSLRQLRCTCRTWNALSKTQVFGKKEARNRFLGFTVMNNRLCSLRLELQGLLNEGELVHQSTKQIGKFDGTKMYKVRHCDGLLLCVHKNCNNIVVWNPYLSQTRCIPTRCDFGLNDVFGFGYANKNRNHKILRVLRGRFIRLALYDLKSDSWRVLDIEPYINLDIWESGVSLKGNTYFVAQQYAVDVLYCFDFTTERFRPPLQFPKEAEYVVLSCVRDEKLAVLYQLEKTMEIWITTKIEHDDVSWSMFLKVETTPLNGFPDDFSNDTDAETFFIDEEKKVAVVSDVWEDEPTKDETCYSQTAHIIGQDGYLKSTTCPKYRVEEALVFSSYVPSLVQVGINQRSKRKHKDCL
ncbi:F-box/kelch-repeat protein [Raphanus sativus]|nr:F-box/kelch-repeat protein [Raphanus sativus]